MSTQQPGPGWSKCASQSRVPSGDIRSSFGGRTWEEGQIQDLGFGQPRTALPSSPNLALKYSFLPAKA